MHHFAVSMKSGNDKAETSMILRTSHAILTLFVAVIFAANAFAAEFKHPGLINSGSRLNALSRLEKESRASDRKQSYYDLLDKDKRFSVDYQPAPMDYVIVTARGMNPMERRFRNDMIAAYFTALRWVKTGDNRYRAKSIEIMNAWSDKFVALDREKGTWKGQIRLEAAWAVPIWANAAEIILYYKHPYGNPGPEWRDRDVKKFRKFLGRLHREIGEARDRVDNQGVATALADMSIGVFNDDRRLYEAGLARARNLMPQIISDDGEVKELRKSDCIHPQYSLIGLTQAAQIEMNQSGKSTLLNARRPGNNEPMLASGIEYMARALTDGTDARDCRTGRLIDGYAPIAKKIYANDNKAPLKQLDKAMSTVPQRMSGLFPEAADVTHGAGVQ
ncbi:alginate lyase family protein [Mycoplana rhizolycopersici]|uniref:Alginate lyase family protein n=1 Tax=Mycoplana rhizolycopersici TaxID=2746702 RepID=A0ABX2QJU7_9HYPH|nr:alginate lyase family protein [Rhizobium rhizolycopersici]NVP57975.1 alginate lyase family protein [Rhizobium rhizolycopersici]